jgi:hypothetical protein
MDAFLRDRLTAGDLASPAAKVIQSMAEKSSLRRRHVQEYVLSSRAFAQPRFS